MQAEQVPHDFEYLAALGLLYLPLTELRCPAAVVTKLFQLPRRSVIQFGFAAQIENGAGGASFSEGASGNSLSGVFYFPSAPIALSGAGNVGNGAIRAPGLVNLDLSLGKTFAVTERSRIQIRADMFNALNHTNLTGLRTSLNDAFFGQLLSTAGARVIQLNTRFSF